MNPDIHFKQFDLVKMVRGFRVYKKKERKTGEGGYVVMTPWGGRPHFNNLRKADRFLKESIGRIKEVSDGG